MLKSINISLDNEDVLYALSPKTYYVLLKFLMRSFALEKSKIENNSFMISESLKQNKGQFLNTSNTTINNESSNELTTEIQRIVSKLLNSKEFTTSLVTLFQILKEALPEDMFAELSDID